MIYEYDRSSKCATVWLQAYLHLLNEETQQMCAGNTKQQEMYSETNLVKLFLRKLPYCQDVYIFQSKHPNFTNSIVFMKKNRNTEYYIAKKRDKVEMEIWLLTFFLCMVNVSELGYNCSFEEHCFLLIIFCMIILWFCCYVDFLP